MTAVGYLTSVHRGSDEPDINTDAWGERALWCAVLHTAIQDATSAVGRFGRFPSEQRERSKAVSFLTDRAGAWAESRDIILGVCDIDPGWFEEKMAARLDRAARRGKPPPPTAWKRQ